MLPARDKCMYCVVGKVNTDMSPETHISSHIKC